MRAGTRLPLRGTSGQVNPAPTFLWVYSGNVGTGLILARLMLHLVDHKLTTVVLF
jgi:hypothetical protein